MLMTMPESTSPEPGRNSEGVTTLLMDLDAGREGAFGELVEAVYDQLRGIAANRMRGQFGRGDPHNMTLPPTAIVNDVVIKLMNQHNGWKNTEHFYAIATRLMMRLLIDYQRRMRAQKRNPDLPIVAIQGSDDVAASPDSVIPPESDSESILCAIESLHELNPRKAEVVTLHVICGLPLPKVAEQIRVSVPTVERDWRFAKRWLAKELTDQPPT